MEEDSLKGMISAISWVPRGAAKNVPVVAEPPTQEEIDEAIKIMALGGDGGSDADEDEEAGEAGTMDLDGAEAEEEELDEVARAKAVAKALAKGTSQADDVADELRELNMDAYDDEEEGIEIFSSGMGDLYYPSNDMDPYLNNNDDEDDDDDEEIDDKMIKPTDYVIVCAHSDEDIFSLQASLLMNILEETEDGEQNMFVHHDVPLPAFPLCTAWMDFNLKGGDKGNFIAVGTMDPAIEIWDLDMVDEVQPHMVLGGLSKKKKKAKGKKGKKYKKGSHRSSVLGLAWNKEVRNVLASASADTTVKIWDVAVGKCAVQSVAWCPQSPEVLLSGSFDKTVAMNDMKDGGQNCHKWSVEADVESLAWDPHNEHSFVVSLENGMVQAFDKRTASSSSSGRSTYTLHAHEKAVSSISFSPSAPDFLATGSTDKMGAIFSVSFSHDNPFWLACGGSKGKLKVWDTLTEPAIAHKFSRQK
ncbi:putative WD repeat-containing protein C17D11.16 [Dichanthelium oligosanthes]|uniref:Putative WD repeat-containing protein C17D11.16 n=1 Tax=Dichanthelium oligosanthes TaxID=888268 RepID=A0A1E5US08_9POAL|nr:putative WD repeat-containing protein C17D11.16 [Dichanthelium oligosanthes]